MTGLINTMNTDEIVYEVKKFFDTIYQGAQLSIEPHFDSWDEMNHRIVNHAISHCYGVAIFAQQLGVPYGEIEVLYSEVKENLQNLLTD